MANPHQISDPTAALHFMLGGNATFTIKSLATGNHLTYKVRTPKQVQAGGPSHFVSVRTGGEKDTWSYLGCLFEGKKFVHGKRSPFADTTPQSKAFKWASAHLFEKVLPPKCEIWHEGTCGRCGRALTDPDSIVRGLGPECAGKSNPFICE